MNDNLARQQPAQPSVRPSPETKPVLDERKKIAEVIDLHEETIRKFEERLQQAEKNETLVKKSYFTFQVDPSTGFESQGEYAVMRENGRTTLLLALRQLPFPHLSLEHAVVEIEIPSSLSPEALKNKLVSAINDQLTQYSHLRRAPLDDRLDRIVEEYSTFPEKKVWDTQEPDRSEKWKRMGDIDKRLSSQSENIVLNEVAQEIVKALKV